MYSAHRSLRDFIRGCWNAVVENPQEKTLYVWMDFADQRAVSKMKLIRWCVTWLLWIVFPCTSGLLRFQSEVCSRSLVVCALCGRELCSLAPVVCNGALF